MKFKWSSSWMDFQSIIMIHNALRQQFPSFLCSRTPKHKYSNLRTPERFFEVISAQYCIRLESRIPLDISHIPQVGNHCLKGLIIISISSKILITFMGRWANEDANSISVKNAFLKMFLLRWSRLCFYLLLWQWFSTTNLVSSEYLQKPI